jgi:D-alanyl-D-alanine dipeptidase
LVRRLERLRFGVRRLARLAADSLTHRRASKIEAPASKLATTKRDYNKRTLARLAPSPRHRLTKAEAYFITGSTYLNKPSSVAAAAATNALKWSHQRIMTFDQALVSREFLFESIWFR